ncbi:orotidine-5'-phosphate decarboxylase [Piromyces finnis]|uniref:Orotidine 5'-phosphate decarboxylase n=1 Tax=Piromyces finnis TaxID=1754191 RepID=A0A1Y1VIS9_9FUNG|nr:orotidine-5'-phosphate decarboxylase [Piromyces finnis]|eukprot:ORX57317.1 orotidine-5'-phosphate decarboxylase [Piromyces finnis]
MAPSFLTQTYSERAKVNDNACAKKLLELMDKKKTNLSVAIDVTKKDDIIRIADLLGPYICVLKTHIDIVEDFDMELVETLKQLAQKHEFLIFEDRKFADIGNTVKHQYEGGVYKIASWSDITNAHPIPGEGIIKGLKEVGLPLNRALLLLAEMSSKGTLAKGQYTLDTIEMAKRNTDFVIGFIGQNRIYDNGDNSQDFLYLTPGVGLETKGDSLGQQYRTPHQVIVESGCDIIIVGRGVYGAKDDAEIKERAEKYRKAGWDAYLERIGQSQ